MINELAQKVHENAKAKGWYDKPKNLGEMLCLIHSEVTEALEADREDRFADNDGFYSWLGETELAEGKIDDKLYTDVFENKIKDTFEDELADIVIRVMDLAAFKNIDLEHHIKAKMRYNTLRPIKHGGKKY